MEMPIEQAISLEKFRRTDWSAKTEKLSTSNDLQYMAYFYVPHVFQHEQCCCKVYFMSILFEYIIVLFDLEIYFKN